MRTIENRQYRLDPEGATFEGRDLFPPSPAWLTRGQPPGSFGRLIHDPVMLARQEVTRTQQRLIGRVMYIDRFGNLITNIAVSDLQETPGTPQDRSWRIRVGGTSIEGLVSSYAAGETNAARALINSLGLLEIFLKNGHAADVLKVRRGDLVEVE